MRAPSSPGLSDTQRETYERDGLILVSLPSDVRALRDTIVEEATAWLKAFTGHEIGPAELPQALAAMAKTQRPLIGKLYKISRRFPSVKQLAVHPWFVELASELMNTTLPSCCHFINVRIDLPTEDRFLLPPHQDFPYIQGSADAVTFWIPLFDTPLSMGPPSWIPGSHRWGVLAVREYALSDIGGSGGKSFSLVDDQRVRDDAFVSGGVSEGEALVFHTMLVHRSEQNTSATPRLNVQLRFDDALSPASFERNYPEGLYLGDLFQNSYPEHVRNG